MQQQPKTKTKEQSSQPSELICENVNSISPFEEELEYVNALTESKEAPNRILERIDVITKKQTSFVIKSSKKTTNNTILAMLDPKLSIVCNGFIFQVVEENEILGLVLALPFSISCDGQIWSSGCTTHLLVDPEFQHQRIASKLITGLVCYRQFKQIKSCYHFITTPKFTSCPSKPVIRLIRPLNIEKLVEAGFTIDINNKEDYKLDMEFNQKQKHKHNITSRPATYEDFQMLHKQQRKDILQCEFTKEDWDRFNHKESPFIFEIWSIQSKVICLIIYRIIPCFSNNVFYQSCHLAYLLCAQDKKTKDIALVFTEFCRQSRFKYNCSIINAVALGYLYNSKLQSKCKLLPTSHIYIEFFSNLKTSIDLFPEKINLMYL